ncbi:MAG: DUF2155 domain-containing protein [Nitrospirae bacterium]|nr:DUF2155 domain-containing protein [Nitrospirota bacterium]
MGSNPTLSAIILKEFMMDKRYIFLMIVVVSMTGFISCTKKEPPTPPPPPKEETSMMRGMTGHADIQMPASEEMKVIVPDDVKTKWKGVILTVVDNETTTTKDYTLQLGGKLAVPGSQIEGQAEEFLPDLKIDGNIYTTATSELLNPAIHVMVTEAGKEIFKGWLFQKFPSVHPLKHQRVGITLKEPLTHL